MDTPLTTGIPWLDRTIAVLFALGALCSLLSHFLPPTTIAGKVVSWMALHFGKQLSRPSGDLVEMKPKGFARLPVICALAGMVLALGALAAPKPEALKEAVISDPNAVQPGADVPPPPAPQFGGRVGRVYFGPSVSMTLVALNLKTKTIEGAFSPGLGYGFTVNPGKWSSFGADAYFTVDPAAQRASWALLLKFFNGYARVGLSKGFVGDVAWRVPVAFGLGF